MDKILAIMHRDFAWLTRWKPNLYAEILTPIAYLVLFAAALSGNFGAISINEGNTSYLLFLLPGLIVLQTFNRFPKALSESSNDRRWGVFRVYMTTKMKPYHYVVGKALVSVSISILQAIFILSVGTLLARQAPFGVTHSIALALTVVSSSLFWTSLGITIGLMTSREEKRSVYTTLLTLPITFSSSIFYDVSKAPKYIYWLSQVNPLTYIADAARASFFGNYEGGLCQFVVTGGITIIAFALAVWKVRTTSLIPDEA